MKTPLWENILSQPSALEQVLAYQLGDGRAAFDRCVQLLRGTKRIVITGMGASQFACGPMRYALAGGGLAVEIVETAELLYALGPTISDETVLVLVSRSGESVETIRLLETLRTKTIGITNVPDSTLARRTNEHILLNSPSDQLVAVQTYVATAALLLLIAAALTEKFDTAVQELREAIALLPAWIEECWSKDRDSFAVSTSALYILARGASIPVAEEGCLLMHECAKTPTIALSIAQFRHGFVEAADAGVRAVIFETNADTLHIDQQFARDLQRMSCTVLSITIPPEVPTRFAFLFEIVPLQVLAYRTAELRGIVPGTFRWASTVTATETGFPGLEVTDGESVSR